MSLGVPAGTVTCAKCKNQYIRVELINLGRTPGIDHVDFYCQVCGQFVGHFDVVPFKTYEPDIETQKMLDEIDEELS